MLAAALRHAAKAGADLDALDRVDAHHRVGDVGVELVVERLAQPDRHLPRDHLNARAAGIAGLAQHVHVRFEPRHDAGVGGEEGIARDLRLVLERDFDLAERAHPAGKAGAVLLAQPFFGDRRGGNGRRRQSRRRAAATARVAQAVLAPVGVVGMAGPERVEDVAVVLAALIRVLDQQSDRRAGGQALVDAAEDLHHIGLAALRHMPARARAAPVEVGLDVVDAQRQAGRAAVDHAADRRAVALAEIGDAKESAESAAGHRWAKNSRGINDAAAGRRWCANCSRF